LHIIFQTSIFKLNERILSLERKATKLCEKEYSFLSKVRLALKLRINQQWKQPPKVAPHDVNKATRS